MLRGRTCQRALQLLRWRGAPPSAAAADAAATLRSSIAIEAAAAGSSWQPAALPPSLGVLLHWSQPYSTGEYKELARLPSHFVSINNLRDVPGATRPRKRVGRGDGSDRGKTSGRGHKGQRARSRKPGLLFDGGTRHLRKFPKVHLQPQ